LTAANYGYIPVSVLTHREDDYVGCVAGNLRAAARVVTREYDAALRPHGLRITQVAILAQLARLQPVTVSVLAEALAGDRSAVSRDLAILSRAGLVSSVVSADDQRARHVSLTHAGQLKLQECAAAWRAAQASMRDRLGKADAAELVQLSGRVVDALTQPESV
jgi:DNA-binding MarR family transcriptional regulator